MNKDVHANMERFGRNIVVACLIVLYLTFINSRSTVQERCFIFRQPTDHVSILVPLPR